MKVLIVDDETAVYEHVKALIPWEELGWTIVGHALNGEDACRLATLHRPQFILTDIRMPIMDGLQFLEWLQHSDISAVILVLSGYGDFDYSRTAFLRGAFDYILKPVQEAELLRALGRAVEKIHNNSAVKTDQINQKAVLSTGLTVLQDELFTDTVGSGEADEHEIVVRAEQLQVELPESGYYLATIRLLNQDEKVNERYGGNRGVFHYAFRNVLRESLEYGVKPIIYRQITKSNEFVVIYPTSDKQVERLSNLLTKLHRSLDRFLQVKVKIGISLHKARLSKLSGAYREASLALESMPLDDKVMIACYGEGASTILSISKDFPNVWRDLAQLFDTLLETGMLRDSELLMTKLDKAFGEEELAGMRGRELKQSASLILEKIELKIQHEEISMLVSEGKSRLQELRIPQVKELLVRITKGLLALSSAELRLKNGKQLIEAIRRDIEENYRTVTLDDISQRFYLNKNYFCTLFKQVTGDSFIEFLTFVRMNHAKRLLTDSNLRTYEIAEQVGYADQRYFSQVFKKYVGVQPTQFRGNKEG